jgi:hypothetical protein
MTPEPAELPAAAVRRRIGSTPQDRGSATNCTCPDIFELADGNFAIVGTLRTAELSDTLPEGATVSPHGDLLVITRETLLAAVRELRAEGAGLAPHG